MADLDAAKQTLLAELLAAAAVELGASAVGAGDGGDSAILCRPRGVRR